MKRTQRQVPLILNKDVEGVGFADELVTVRAGFARNFLLPRSLAAAATPSLIKDREAVIAKAAARREQEVAARQEVAGTLEAEPLALTLKVGPGGRVFGSITAAKFAAALKADRKAEVDPKGLHGLPINGLGGHTVSAKLGLGVVAQIPVRVTGEATKPKPDLAKKATPAKATISKTTKPAASEPDPTPTT